MQTSSFLCILFFLSMARMSTIAASLSLKIGFYNQSCPSAEAIVKNVVKKAIIRNPGLGAGLIRMHFHDCFVRGCDASVLLDSTPGSKTEKEHFINNPSLRGYEVIDEAKAELEAQCPQTVSCADILAFAARDSAYLLGGIKYALKSGRRDGLVSLIDEPLLNLPAPFFDLQLLHQFFKKKGLSLEEMVTLSGAHSIGVSNCSAVIPRLYPSNNSNPRDPLMDPKFSNMLKSKCPNASQTSFGVVNQTVYEDFLTPYKLDNKYYQNIVNRRVLFTSDQILMASPETATMVKIFGERGEIWARKFAKAMVRMGSIEVLTGCQGEIRKCCRTVNRN